MEMLTTHAMPQPDGWSQLPPAQPHSQSCGAACPGGAPGTPSPRSSFLHSESRTPIPPPPSPLLPPSSHTWLQRPALGSSYQQQPRQDLQEGPHLPGPCGAVAPTLRDRQSRDEGSRAGSALPRAARARQGPAGREQEAAPGVPWSRGAESPGHAENGSAWRGGRARGALGKVKPLPALKSLDGSGWRTGGGTPVGCREPDPSSQPQRGQSAGRG